jgi:hypothetical protein
MTLRQAVRTVLPYLYAEAGYPNYPTYFKDNWCWHQLSAGDEHYDITYGQLKAAVAAFQRYLKPQRKKTKPVLVPPFSEEEGRRLAALPFGRESHTHANGKKAPYPILLCSICSPWDPRHDMTCRLWEEERQASLEREGE